MAPGPCCITGVVSSTEATGTVTTIHGLNTYVAKPDGNAKGLVVIIPDAFGWNLSNSRVLADKLAKKGQFLVYLPDFMIGKPVDPNVMTLMDKLMAPTNIFYKIFVKPILIFRAAWNFIPFVIRNSQAKVTAKVTPFFQSLRSSPETEGLKIGAAGYCWGGKYTVLLTHGPTPLIDAGFTAHPSNLVMPDIEQVKAPLCISVGDIDMAWKIDFVNQAKGILEKKKDTTHEVNILPGAKHGFAVRADPADEKQVEFCELAEKQAVDWFTKWLA